MVNPNVVVASDYGPMIVNRFDRCIGLEISTRGFWAQDDIQLIKSLINLRLEKSGGQITFYDVGANIGTHTLAIAKSFPTNVRLRSFEAQRQIYYMLCGTLALNGVANVVAHHAAVSDVHGEPLDIPLPNYNLPNNLGSLELVTPRKSDNDEMIVKAGHEVVTTLTLDSFGERLDFLKMDIEGMEDRALKGAVQAIERHRPICFVEVNKTDTQFVLDYFKARSFLGFQKGDDVIFMPAEYQLQVEGLARVI